MSSFDFNSDLNVNILGHIFENSIGDLEELKSQKITKRKKDGVYYTPEYITDYICKNTIIPYLSKTGKSNTITSLINEYLDNIDELDNKIKNIKILDPACGSGAFLNKATDILLRIHKDIHDIKFKNTKETLDVWVDESIRKQILINNIYGVDINPESVEISKLAMFLNIAKKGVKLPSLDKNIKCGNSLINDNRIDDKAFDWKKEFHEIFDDGGFDIVIGNPPYVNVTNLQYDNKYKLYLKKNFRSAYQKYDLYSLFIELSLNLLKKGGKSGFIIPFPFLNQDYALTLRKYLLSITIEEIVDLTKFKIFDSASVKNIILFLENSKNNNNHTRIKFQSSNPQVKGIINNFNLLPQNYFNDTYHNMFRLELCDGTTRSIINKIQLLSDKKLEDVVFSSWGARGSPIKDFHFDEKINNFCKKLVKGSNIDRYNLNYTGKWLLYDLNKLYRSPLKEFFESEKIIIRKVSGDKGLIATYDDKKYYADDSICCITLKYNFKNLNEKRLRMDFNEDISINYDLKYILALINSKLLNFYFKNMVGYDLNVYPSNILVLPFKSLDSDKQNIFINIVNRLLNCNDKLNSEANSFKKWLKREFSINILSNKLKEYYNLDFEEFIKEIKKKNKNISQRNKQKSLEKEFNNSLEVIIPLKSEIKSLENEINQKIYSLYELTSEEIAIIEKTIK